MASPSVYYADYLSLNSVLTSQRPESFRNGHPPAHDEMLFIITHQAFELWFKQILFELDYIQQVFAKEVINDNSEDLNLVRHRLSRIRHILDLLNHQVEILDTMTPLDFLEFRNLLNPSSGFQSLQFRLIEARLGLKLAQRHQAEYYKRTGTGGFRQDDYDRITEVESKASLLEQVNDWLARMPFFEPKYWTDYRPLMINSAPAPFWADYRELYANSLSEYEKPKLADFERLFLDPPSTGTESRPALSQPALKAALFIMLYRDFPVFQNSFRILDMLIEIDHALSTWRYKHLMMVRRMIGLRVGTGNTSGAGYLEGALASHHIFKDISMLNTFLIPRNRLPQLPDGLVRMLGFTL